MSYELARYLTCLIAREYDKKHKGCISSYICEVIESKFKEGDFEEIEKYLRRNLWAN